ncbi:MAG TPA: 30S ribosomal protein S9 [Candidatus Methylomirabilis sp.]|nr:30S ribosomal protein S9 [Candidatus Methylomirabilis sp.]
MPTKKTTKKSETAALHKEVHKEEAEVKEEISATKGKYIKAIGRRKTATAQVRVYLSGKGEISINGKPMEKYFDEDRAAIAVQPLKLTGVGKEVDITILAKGGGVNSQAEATRHGLARVLILLDPELDGAIRAKGWLTRDSRKVERKKPGLKKARRAPQWSKR